MLDEYLGSRSIALKKLPSQADKDYAIISPSTNRGKGKQTVRLFTNLLGVLAATIAVLAIFPPVSAAENTGGSVQSYAADRRIDHGTIVQLNGENSNRVKVASQAEQQNMFGVTVDPKHLPVRLTNEGLENEAYVAVSGTYNVLVSTQAGPIKVGDHLALSSINGVAMNAGTEKTTVFGRAAKAFDGEGLILGTASLKDDADNTAQTVKLGSIPVTVDIKRNPNEKSTEANVPDALKRIGQAIAEKEVSPIRIYLSMAITAISLVAAIVVLYSGIRNGVISIGRNPMSKKSIFRALLEIILTSVLILIIGLFAVYLLLKL